MIHDWGQIARPSGKPAVNQPTFSFKATKLLRELYDVVTDTVTTEDRTDETAARMHSLGLQLRDEMAPVDDTDHHAVWVPEYEKDDVYEDGES